MDTLKDDSAADVRAAIEQLSRPSDTPPSTGAGQQPQDSAPGSEEPEAALDAVAEKPERARDPETGQFVKAPTERSSDKATGEPVKPVPVAKEAVEAPAEPSPVPVGKPPTSWSPEARAEWQKLSPALQQAVLKREKEMSDGQAQYSDTKRRWQEIDGIIAPRRAYYQRFGFKSDAEAINHLLTLSDSMERDAPSTLVHLARHYNVDLARLTGGQAQPGQQQPQPQPSVDLDSKVQEQVALQFARMTVQEFEQQPPEHYQEVKPLMKQLLEIGQAADMQDAYDKAVWMHPETRAKLLEAKATEDAKRVQAQKPAIEKKIKASNASLSGAPHGATAPSRPNGAARGAFGEVADDVRAAIAQLG